MMSISIYDRFHPEALEYLRTNTDQNLHHYKDNNFQKDDDTKILIIRSRHKITSDILSYFPNLKLIISGTSGFDHIDYNFCNANKILSSYCPEANAISAAELTWAMILNQSRYLNLANQSLLANQWRDQVSLGNELFSKKIFIIGLGRIGSRLAHYADAFGLEVFYFDPYIKKSTYKKLSLEEGFLNADIISSHLPKTKKTKNLISSSLIRKTKKNLIFINTSRGDIVAQDALEVIRTERGDIRLALDVFLEEPPATKDLQNFRYALFSPHIGAYTEEAFLKASMLCAEKSLAYLKGEPLQNTLPPKLEWLQDI